MLKGKPEMGEQELSEEERSVGIDPRDDLRRALERMFLFEMPDPDGESGTDGKHIREFGRRLRESEFNCSDVIVLTREAVKAVEGRRPKLQVTRRMQHVGSIDVETESVQLKTRLISVDRLLYVLQILMEEVEKAKRTCSLRLLAGSPAGRKCFGEGPEVKALHLR
ncbi:MAG: hypothetical protein WC518_01995 [Patescibacteria group bacterium]